MFSSSKRLPDRSGKPRNVQSPSASLRGSFDLVPIEGPGDPNYAADVRAVLIRVQNTCHPRIRILPEADLIRQIAEAEDLRNAGEKQDLLPRDTMPGERCDRIAHASQSISHNDGAYPAAFNSFRIPKLASSSLTMIGLTTTPGKFFGTWTSAICRTQTRFFPSLPTKWPSSNNA